MFSRHWRPVWDRASVLLGNMINRLSSRVQRMGGDPERTSATGTSLSIGYVPIAIVALIGIIVTWDAFREINDWEHQRLTQEFRNAASDRVLMVQRELDLTLGVVRDIGSFIDASPRIGRKEYRKFVGPALIRYSSIVALEWIPQVKTGERAVFEADARRSFSRFRITERNPEGGLIDAGLRPIHFPVLYVQPYQQNKERLGLDLAADPPTLDELLRIRETGDMQLSSRIPLDRNSKEEFGFSARLPVYEGGESSNGETGDNEESTEEAIERREMHLRGFAAGIFHIGSIVESALENLSPIGIDMVIHDVSDVGDNAYLYRHASRKRVADKGATERGTPTDNEAFVQTLNMANRQWEVTCTAVPGYFQLDTRRGWTVLAGGWAFTILLTIYLSTLVGRAAKINRLVTERTLQLTAANAALNKEIGERIDTQIELQMLNDTLEQRVEERTAEAEQNIKELEQFAYVTSHDLKAPLRSISNLATWLEEDLEEKHTEASREQLELLRDRVQRMDALIEGLLEYSRIGRTERAIDTVDVAQLLAEAVDSLAVPEEFSIIIGDGMPTLSTERLQLYQVFANLISNAIKHHGSPQGTVRVTVEDQGSCYEFAVADDGPGIAPQYHEKIFKIFQTLEARDYGSSTGIGLALVKKIVQEHGGSITLDSEEGKGATFRFTWSKDE